ncbi:MAG: 4-vinyl reductase [Anaerolineae bacterium]|nr:4-vinyl reductase [Anaerolineae bacterium]
MGESHDLVIVNALMRQALTAIEEVMGKHGLDAVLRASNLEQYIDHLPPDDLEPAVNSSDYARLNQAIEDFYGRGGRGILRRVGKASFNYAVREQSALLGLVGNALKLLPHKQRIRFILNSLGNALKKTNDMVRVEVEQSGDGFAYVAHTCSVCYGRHSDHPICHLYVGTVGEAVKWATGQEYRVEETHCIAKCDPYCRFEVIEQTIQ